MPEARTTQRSRVLPAPPRGSAEESIEVPDGNPVAVYDRTYEQFWPDGKQITVSEGHPFHVSKKKRGKGDVGGPFSTFKNEIEVGSAIHNVEHRYRRVYYEPISVYRFKGPIYAVPPEYIPDITANNPPYPDGDTHSESELNQMGATAIARCQPTNPLANAATFLGELKKDGLAHLPGSQTWKARSEPAKNAGSEYLNVQFGWLPIVNEVRAFADSIRHADAVITQYERDAGKIVRRRYEFPQEEEEYTEDTPLIGAYGPVSAEFNRDAPPPARVKRTVRKVRNVWFSGAFTYYLPSDYKSRKGMKAYASLADKLFGTDITPEVLWDLAPWSWAVDWFSNTGDVISNLSSFAGDDLVMHYGYLMEHVEVSHTYSCDLSDYAGMVPVNPVTYRTISKRRIKANPFGFGISWDGLSPYQISIAAALGLSRS